jgi:hypothetical protein
MAWKAVLLANNEDMPKELRGKVWGLWGTPDSPQIKILLKEANMAGKTWASGKGKLNEARYRMANLTYFVWSDEPERNEWGEVSP